ncbi:MAG: hypothetical protein GY719_07330 [bacterium]|nr:hypothetical protein [bacterium]
MIAPLRRRHRWMTVTLALAVPVLYVAALAVRPDEPAPRELPATLAGAGSRPGQPVTELGDLFADPRIAVTTSRGGGHWWLWFEPAAPVTRPETLVYWAPSAPDLASGVPDDAYLLGTLAGSRRRAFALPASVWGRAGWLVLYSLGHQEAFATAELPPVGGRPPVVQDPPLTLGLEEPGS